MQNEAPLFKSAATLYAIGSSRESNSSRRICNLRVVPLGHVADIKDQKGSISVSVTTPSLVCAVAKIFIFKALNRKFDSVAKKSDAF